MPTSAVLAAKRDLVKLVRQLAKKYAVIVAVDRDSDPSVLLKSYKDVALKVHPDKGGDANDMKLLTAARSTWEATRSAAGEGKGGRRAGQAAHQWERTSGAAPAAGAPPLTSAPRGVRPEHALASVQRKSWTKLPSPFTFTRFAVLLTYHLRDKKHFYAMMRAQKTKHREWGVRRWCATLEACTTTDGLHAHVMLQFWQSTKRSLAGFELLGVKPNASINDYCGGSIGGRNAQMSIDRGMFYVFADKIGTASESSGKICVYGNYFPCWETGRCEKYQVKGAWAETLWKKRKLTHAKYKEYLFLTRDGVISRKRNLDAVVAHEEELEEKIEMEAVVKRIRSNKALFKPFPVVRGACEWQGELKADALRYPILITLGESGKGKTEWTKSLFKRPFVLQIGALGQFPDRMRKFERKLYDALVLDDVRDLKFVEDHQDKLQGKYDALLEFGTTAGGTCAFTKWLFRVPVAVTINFSTRHLEWLVSHDWLSRPGNRALAIVGDVPRQHQWVLTAPRAFPVRL